MAIHEGLALTDEQLDLRTTLRDFLTDKLTSQALRAQIDTEDGFDRPLWFGLASELGLVGLSVAERHGGLGLGPAEAAIAHQELGRSLYPGPFLATSLAATALAAADDADAAARWLPPIASGELVATCALSDSRGSWHAPQTVVRASGAGGRWQLTGSRTFVLAGHVADVLLVPAASAAGLSLFLVEADAQGLTTAAVPGLDLTRKLATVSLENTPATLVGVQGQADDVLRSVAHALQLAASAEAAGGIDWCLEAGVGHAKTREQFGRPIGSFQAVAHAAVDILTHREFTSAGVRYAAVATAQGDPEAELATRVTVLRAGEAYRQVAEATIHLFGGTGFTWEHDAHLYYRRAWSDRQLSGGAQDHRAAVAALAGL
ncbi:acyl-CoA dehydrogenase family protein [Streptomyces sp. NPDC051218]|uniref:acyl-CoA dehydrogenase family protein n=1 Tax=Streptomyces sp. NPDC051218 TaxID=3365645 RepID=UPI0037AFFC6D